jgi:hypothetical protein
LTLFSKTERLSLSQLKSDGAAATTTSGSFPFSQHKSYELTGPPEVAASSLGALFFGLKWQ